MAKIGPFSNELNAKIAEGFLQNNGIDCNTKDNPMSTLYNTPDTYIIVSDDDEEKASELIEENKLL